MLTIKVFQVYFSDNFTFVKIVLRSLFQRAKFDKNEDFIGNLGHLCGAITHEMSDKCHFHK